MRPRQPNIRGPVHGRVLAGREDTLELLTLPLIDMFVTFFNRDILQSQGCSRGTFGGGARGGVCLNGRGLKPVSEHRDTGAANGARETSLRTWLGSAAPPRHGRGDLAARKD